MLSATTSTAPADPLPVACDILFVDDDVILRAAFTELLRLQGFAVHAAGSGREALAFLARQQPRLIITDIFMPDTDGIELIMGLRKSWPQAGVLAISGGSYGPPDLFLKTARLLGRARTLSKPFLPDELIAIVKEMIGATVSVPQNFAEHAGG